MLLEYSHVLPETPLEFLSAFTFHGVRITRTECILLAEGVYQVLRILVVSGEHYYLWLKLVSPVLRVDDMGTHYFLPEDVVSESNRLLSLHSGSGVTGVYTIREPDGETLVIVRW